MLGHWRVRPLDLDSSPRHPGTQKVNDLVYPYRDPGSPNLRMVSWNLNTIRFVSVMKDTPKAHQLRI